MPDPSILNVDDYLPGRYARTRVLRQLGVPVYEAATGAEAFAMVNLHKPDLILLDVNLPDISGFDICRQLRADPETSGTTIVHISASSVATQHQVHGLDAGADGYLVEPVEPSVLLATVNAFLRARRAEEALRRSNEELRWFAYRVGHDLSEPLRTMTTYAQIVKSRLAAHDDPNIATYLDFIASGAIRIRTFMDGLLNYSEAGIAEFDRGTVDCETMLDRVRQNLDSAIRESGAILTHDPLPIVRAGSQLEHVFQNLVSNAIKYSQEDVFPQIHVSARQEGASWIFSVKDNGKGIEPQYWEKIFEVFARLEGQRIHGNGIGLALVRRIVEAHQGKIWLDSESGKGSTFYFELPV